jgi:glycosyltransferase involved in cell wall biosynthesis
LTSRGRILLLNRSDVRQQPHASRTDDSVPVRRLLVLDSAYALEAIRDRRLERSVTCRDLDGFFDHVWSVHPFATLVTSERWSPREGAAREHRLAERHTVIEGCVGRWRALRFFPPLNFVAAQLALIVQLVALIRRERIDVIRAGDPLYLGLLGLILSRLCGVPLLVRVGGNHDKVFEITGRPMMPRLFHSRRVEKRLERLVLSRADLVAGANEDNLAFARSNGASADRSTLFRYGNLIDPRHFVAPASRPEGESLLLEIGVGPGRFLLYVGRLEPVKQPDHVLRVLAELRRRGHQLDAVLVGDGSMWAQLRALSRELGVEDRVHLCGVRNQEWLSRVAPLAALAISPHTGRALAEVGLAAVPIVAYDVDWQGEVIKPGATGELVEHGDWMAMAAAADALLRDPVRAQRLGRALREMMRAMMDPAALDRHERASYAAMIDRYRAERRARSHRQGVLRA